MNMFTIKFTLYTYYQISTYDFGILQHTTSYYVWLSPTTNYYVLLQVMPYSGLCRKYLIGVPLDNLNSSYRLMSELAHGQLTKV